MDPFEKAIRGAFEKSDPSDIAVRRRVYRSALNALERALQGNDNVTDSQAKARRGKLKTLIKSIESEFTVAVPENKPADKVAAALAPSVSIDNAPRNTAPRAAPPVANARQEPSFGNAEPAAAKVQELAIEEASKPGLAARIRTRNLRNEGKKSRWSKFAFNAAIFLLLIFVAIYAVRWVLSTDLRQFASSNSNDGNLEFTSQAVGAKQDKNWITIFDPQDVSTVRVGDGAQARLSADGRATYLQLASSTANSVTIFDVGLGVLQDFAGKDATIVIRAKTVRDEKSEMAVSCDFNVLGKCTRKRFTVTNELQDFIFDFSFANQTPANSGAIEIISDIEGGGIPLNLVAIQIREKPKN